MNTVNDKITYDAVLEAMRAAVAEKGEDYLYSGPIPDNPTLCVYATEVDGELKPSCIVGHVLYRLGLASGVDAPLHRLRRTHACRRA